MNTTTHTNEMVDIAWRSTLAIAAVAIFAVIPLEALAASVAAGEGSGSAFDVLFCNIISVVTGSVGRGIATIAIIVIGIGALMGKIAWSLALIVAVGIGILFGAGSLVEAISGQGQSVDTGTSGTCETKDIIATF